MTKQTYDQWLAEVDVRISARFGVSLHDLEDYTWRDWYEDGVDPDTTASEYISDWEYDHGFQRVDEPQAEQPSELVIWDMVVTSLGRVDIDADPQLFSLQDYMDIKIIDLELVPDKTRGKMWDCQYNYTMDVPISWGVLKLRVTYFTDEHFIVITTSRKLDDVWHVWTYDSYLINPPNYVPAWERKEYRF